MPLNRALPTFASLLTHTKGVPPQTLKSTETHFIRKVPFRTPVTTTGSTTSNMEGATGGSTGESLEANAAQTPLPSSGHGFDEDCAICFETLNSDQQQLQTHTLPCSHTFHEECLNKLRSFEQLRQVCPLCRASLPMTPEQICEEAGGLYIELELWVENGDATWDHPQAKRLMSMWLEASEHGHAGAQCNFALMHMLGRCVPQDEAVGLSWYHKSAAQGNPNAMYNLGLIFELGQAGQAQNCETAAFWYRKSANLGYARAQFNLGSLYEVGKGVTKNEATAAMWYGQGQAQNHFVPTVHSVFASFFPPHYNSHQLSISLSL